MIDIQHTPGIIINKNVASLYETFKQMNEIISIIAIIMFFLTFSVDAQTISPGDPGGGPSGGDDPIGGGAPLGGGSFILIGLAAAYGGKKIYDFRKNMEEIED